MYFFGFWRFLRYDSMAGLSLLLFALLLFYVNEVNSFIPKVKSALTADFCGIISNGNRITVKIVAQNDETTHQVEIKTVQGKTEYKYEIPDLENEAVFIYQSKQTALKQVTLSSLESICLNALVVNTAIVVDQPTDFMETCPPTTNGDVSDRPCKQLDESIDMSSLFICPQRLKDLLSRESVIRSTPRQEPKLGKPPIYDITNDMAQASLTIATGIIEFKDSIAEARGKYNAGKRINPLEELKNFKLLKTVETFIQHLAPVFGVFGGVTTILTTYLTPNPFDEIAKYLDKQFERVNHQLVDIQTDIADLGRLIEAKSGVLGMSTQIRALRHSTRNYGAMMSALSKRPVCGANESFEMKEVLEFMRQYEADDVDNCLLDLYGVEFGELAETTSLLRPYMLAYCHNKRHLIQKLADELIYYGYSGLLSHFTYSSLVAAFKEGEFKVDNVWLGKLYKFLRKVSAFKEASKRPVTDSSRTTSLQYDLEGEILMKVKEDEDAIIDWLEKRIFNENDWPYKCLMKGAEEEEERLTLMLYIDDTDDYTMVKKFQSSETIKNYEPEEKYFNLRKIDGQDLIIQTKRDDRCDERKHNLIVVFYCAKHPSKCKRDNKVVVSWSMAQLCFFKLPEADYRGSPLKGLRISKSRVDIPSKWVETVDHF